MMPCRAAVAAQMQQMGASPGGMWGSYGASPASAGCAPASVRQHASPHGLIMPAAADEFQPSSGSGPSSSQGLSFFWDAAALYGEALGSIQDDLR